MVFSRGKEKDFPKFKFILQDSSVDIVDKYKCLEIAFFLNGDLKHAADDSCNKGLKALFSLRKKSFLILVNTI